LGGLHHQYTEREFPIVTGLFGFKFSIRQSCRTTARLA
jgi:hypothetical protein